MNHEKLLETLEDKVFVGKLLQLETAEEVQEIFKSEKELDISLEEIHAMHQAINQDSGELTDGGLENVAGGVISLHNSDLLNTIRPNYAPFFPLINQPSLPHRRKW